MGWDGMVLVFVVFRWETRHHPTREYSTYMCSLGDKRGHHPTREYSAYMWGNPVPRKKADELVLAHAVTGLILMSCDWVGGALKQGPNGARTGGGTTEQGPYGALVAMARAGGGATKQWPYGAMAAMVREPVEAAWLGGKRRGWAGRASWPDGVQPSKS